MFGFEDRTRALLAAVRREGNVAAAARSIGLDPANAHRHLRVAERRHGAPLVASRRGGRGGRNTTLTRAGRSLLGARGLAGRALAYRPEEGLTPVLVGARTLFVAGPLAPGPVELDVPPESVVLERGARPSAGASPRNRIPMRVDRVAQRGEGTYLVRLAAGSLRLESLVVRGALRELRLRPGSRVVAVVKAVAIQAARPGGEG